jgi:hypothetical protein
VPCSVTVPQDRYQHFLVPPLSRTRRTNQTGGLSVDVDAYCLKMADPSIDGDATTLQALSDALRCRIQVVKTAPSEGAKKRIGMGRVLIVQVLDVHPADEASLTLDPALAPIQVPGRWVTLDDRN